MVAMADSWLQFNNGSEVKYIEKKLLISPKHAARSDAVVLALGAWFKNTVCILQNGQAEVSRGHGDLNTPEACIAFEETTQAIVANCADHKKNISLIVHDLHPNLHSTEYAIGLADQFSIPLLSVQHHHAHIAALLSEHNAQLEPNTPVLGLALDGVGLGSDGKAWGGELLYVEGARFQRLGHLYPLPLPGGDRATREPWRMGAAALHVIGRNEEITVRYADQSAAKTLAIMLRKNINTPTTSSMGRLFDAAAGLLGICPRMEFEGQAAIQLEKLAAEYGPVEPISKGYLIGVTLDFRPLLKTLAEFDDPNHAPNSVSYAAAMFHATVAAGLAHWLLRAIEETQIHTIAFGGGCFLNKVMTQTLEAELQKHTSRPLHLLKAQQFSPGDSAISLGQAWIGAHSLQ